MIGPFCPYCSCTAVIVGHGKQLFTGLDVTAIHCNRCNTTTRILGVSL